MAESTEEYMDSLFGTVYCRQSTFDVQPAFNEMIRNSSLHHLFFENAQQRLSG